MDPATDHQRNVRREQAMTVREALGVLVAQRQDDHVVVTNQSASRIWPLLGKHALDFHYNPSTMGGAVPLALGLAIAQPNREVIVVSGDGALLMNLGSLVSVVAANATNLTVVVLDNGVYDVTGGQVTAGFEANVDFVGIAHSTGFPTVQKFDTFGLWQEARKDLHRSPGPRFVTLRVLPADRADLDTPSETMSNQIGRLRRELILTKP